jgi:hypothetical protein
MVMTQDKALKNAIRERMAAVGEPYSVARRAILSEDADSGERSSHDHAPGPDAVGETAEDYYARYSREAREAGVPEADIAARLQAMMAAEQAQEATDDVQAFADQMQRAADQAWEAVDEYDESDGSDHNEDEDDDLPGGPHARFRSHPSQPPRVPGPPRAPRPPFGSEHGPRTGPDRLLRRLDQLQHRFDTFRDRTDRSLDPLGQESNQDRGDH